MPPHCDDPTLRLATSDEYLFVVGCSDNGDGTFETVKFRPAISGANAAPGSGGNGEDATIVGGVGDGSGRGGRVYVIGGNAGASGIDGGWVSIKGGIGDQGGSIEIISGPGHERGGDITIQVQSGGLFYLLVPDADPHVEGAAFWNNGVLTRSAG